MSDSKLRVVTLNCWGLKYVSQNRQQRIWAIGSELARLDHDIIALQEIWVFADYEYVRAKLIKKHPYAKFFYSGALGAGLAIFSRFPILSATVLPYSLNGSPVDVVAGDWFVGKAAASIVIQHPVLGEVEVFNTHLYAQGGEDGPEHFRAHRVVNAWEFAKVARRAADLGRYVIGMGDFNSIPTSLPMEIILLHAGLTDTWTATHDAALLPTGTPTPTEAITTFGITADSPINTFTAGKPLTAHALKFQGKRLDYILFRQPRKGSRDGLNIPLLHCTSSRVVFTQPVPGQLYSYSDHFGLEATFEIQPPVPSDSTDSLPVAAASTTLHTELSDTTLGFMLTALMGCYRHARVRSQYHLTIFGTCLLFVLALILGAPWLPQSWAASIFLIAGTFFAWLATTMLYAGFIWGNWERNALQNVIEELELLRVHANSVGTQASSAQTARTDSFTSS